MISDKPDQDWGKEEVFIFPASFAQQRLWFIEQLLPGNALYVIPLVFRLTGVLQRSPLQQSLQTIVERHEILRTTFEMVDGQLVQAIAAAPMSEGRRSSDQKFPLRLTDLRTIPASVREEIALAQIWEAIQQPFSLLKGPLFRVQLWQLQETEHLLLLALHHIIFDEWSSGVLVRELGDLYASRVEGRPLTLPDLPIQYADFAHWQRQWLQGEVLNTQLRYWKHQLQDVPVLLLPGTAAHPSGGHPGGSQWLEFPQSLLEALEDVSQRWGVTLFMTLLAAFQTLLHRYTGQTDIAIGSPIANRHHSELEGLIGFLVNSLVLRTNLEGDPPFCELVERVRDVTLAAYAHQDLPFEKLVEELQPLRSLGQNPLFQVVFALQNTPMEDLVLPGLVLSSVELETRTARFALELYVWKGADNFRNLWGKDWQQSDGLRGVIVYNTDVFDAPTIAALRQQFQTLLEGIVTNPEQPLSALPLLTPTEQQRMLQRWSHDSLTASIEGCIQHRFEVQVRGRPTAIALQFHAQSFTYEALNQGSNQLARYLQRLGVGAEMPVGICLERGAEAIAAMLAILKAGGAYVPLDPSYPPERLHSMVKDAGITMILTQTQTPWANNGSLDCTTVICLDQMWDAIAQESDENLSISGTADQLAYILYTSGSTGTPKGVMVTHRAVNRLVQDTNYIQITPGDRIAQVATLTFDAATFEVWGALLNGAQLIGLEREITLSPEAFAAALQHQQISILFLTTALFNQTARHHPEAFQSLRYLLFGGERVNVDAVRAVFHQGKPQHFLHMYGPTENTTFSTAYEIHTIPEQATTIPIGAAIANTQVYLLDAHLKPVPAGANGEIYVGGAGLARGYVNRPDLTAERFIDVTFNLPDVPSPLRLYRTGDRALYRSDGNLEFLGRTDHQVKIRGFRVELAEIEANIARHPQVQTAVVVVRERETDTHQLIAYVVPIPPASLTERELRACLKRTLPAYMLPAAFVIVETIPLTATGKVDQKALPAPDRVRAREFTPVIAPTTSLEACLVELWGTLLGRHSIGIDDNFFELGGHSLLATQLVSRIRDRLQVELPLRHVFETPTIAELAQAIESLKGVSQRDSRRFTSLQVASELPRREEIEL